MPREVKRWAVVCKDLHYATGPYPSPVVAARVAAGLNQHNIESGAPCRFIIIDFFIQTMTNDEARKALADDVEKKERLN